MAEGEARGAVEMEAAVGLVQGVGAVTAVVKEQADVVAPTA